MKEHANGNLLLHQEKHKTSIPVQTFDSGTDHIVMEMDQKKRVTKLSSFTEQKARRLLGLQIELKENLLSAWEQQAAQVDVTAVEEQALQRLQAKLKLYVRGWNVGELNSKFVGPLIELVDFDHYESEVTTFWKRSLHIQIEQQEIKGIVDLMIATGISEPEHPFFFLHEYKKEQESSGDAVGQLLATMFVAQELNKQPQVFSLFKDHKQTFEHVPIYGVYVIGRLWFFARLKQNRYYISEAYDSLDEKDLRIIFKLLKAQKAMIMELVQAVPV